MIEAEVRSFIADEQYDALIRFFDTHAKLELTDEQETLYFDAPEDLRIQRNDHYSKIWLKKGKLHDDAREEIEVRCKKEDYASLLALFSALYKVKIKWLRRRRQYQWDGITVCIDDTKGYGKIIELEKMCTPEHKDDTVSLLKQKMNELAVVITPKEEFKERFAWYEKNWKTLI